MLRGWALKFSSKKQADDNIKCYHFLYACYYKGLQASEEIASCVTIKLKAAFAAISGRQCRLWLALTVENGVVKARSG